jgi:hypothetical protein
MVSPRFQVVLSFSRGSFLLTHLKLRACRSHHIVLPRFAFVVVHYTTEGYMFLAFRTEKIAYEWTKKPQGTPSANV